MGHYLSEMESEYGPSEDWGKTNRRGTMKKQIEGLSYEELYDLIQSLTMHINYIQTGNVVLSSEDVSEREKWHTNPLILSARGPHNRNPPKSVNLTIDQMKTIVKLDELRSKLMKEMN